MNILICDDLREEADELDEMLKNSGFSVNTAVFYDGYDALDYLKTGAVADICILDIVMPDMNGIELARELRDNGFTGVIVFLSTSKDYGPETYRVKAFDYLLKPPTPDAVRDMLASIENVHRSVDTDGIMAKTKGIARFLPFREISYAEVINHKVYYRLANGESVEVTAAFGEIAPELLRDKRFVQCHNSYIVNMDGISSITGREISMRNGAKIPISKSYSEVKKKYLQWVAFGGDGK